MGIKSIGDGRAEDTFTQGGFTDWKHALNKFETHECSKSHKFSQSQLTYLKHGKPIDAQINEQSFDPWQFARDQTPGIKLPGIK